MTILDIQKALAAKGFDPGALDGAWGRRTAAAVRAFQTSKGLLADGVVGPKTVKALLTDAKSAKDSLDDVTIVWFQESRRLMGLREDTGSGSNATLLDWADKLGLDYDSDDIPWCGLFVAHCIGATLTTEPLPNNPLSARSWMKFGGPCTPRPGAVMVFWRGSREGWQGHVAFYVGEDAKAYHVLGGNQSDSVCITRIAKDRLLGARWPATVPLSKAGPRKVSATGVLSKNEA